MKLFKWNQTEIEPDRSPSKGSRRPSPLIGGASTTWSAIPCPQLGANAYAYTYAYAIPSPQLGANAYAYAYAYAIPFPQQGANILMLTWMLMQFPTLVIFLSKCTI